MPTTQFHGLAHGGLIHVVQKDPISTHLECTANTRQIIGLHFDGHAGQFLPRAGNGLAQVNAAYREVVVLHQHHVEQAHAVVGAPAGGDCGLLKHPPAWRGLSGIKHRCGPGGPHELGGMGGDSRQVRHAVQQRALG